MECLKCVENIPEMCGHSGEWRGRNRWGGGPSLRWAPSVYISEFIRRKQWEVGLEGLASSRSTGRLWTEEGAGPPPSPQGSRWGRHPLEVCRPLGPGQARVRGLPSACFSPKVRGCSLPVCAVGSRGRTSRAQFRHLIECCELVLPMRPGVCLPVCLPACLLLKFWWEMTGGRERSGQAEWRWAEPQGRGTRGWGGSARAQKLRGCR